MNVDETAKIVEAAGEAIHGVSRSSRLNPPLAAAGAEVVVSDLDEPAALAVSEQINAEHPGAAVGVGAAVMPPTAPGIGCWSC
ncbi:hypothetical protein [Nocardia sp. NPDC060249]|uniref:hypothetical protein n=1 Tax=Nocardia sp. NPDC060249 TaxID=3347082 RepID=UPI00364E8D3C